MPFFTPVTNHFRRFWQEAVQPDLPTFEQISNVNFLLRNCVRLAIGGGAGIILSQTLPSSLVSLFVQLAKFIDTEGLNYSPLTYRLMAIEIDLGNHMLQPMQWVPGSALGIGIAASAGLFEALSFNNNSDATTTASKLFNFSLLYNTLITGVTLNLQSSLLHDIPMYYWHLQNPIYKWLLYTALSFGTFTTGMTLSMAQIGATLLEPKLKEAYVELINHPKFQEFCTWLAQEHNIEIDVSDDIEEAHEPQALTFGMRVHTD